MMGKAEGARDGEGICIDEKGQLETQWIDIW